MRISNSYAGTDAHRLQKNAAAWKALSAMNTNCDGPELLTRAHGVNLHEEHLVQHTSVRISQVDRKRRREDVSDDESIEEEYDETDTFYAASHTPNHVPDDDPDSDSAQSSAQSSTRGSPRRSPRGRGKKAQHGKKAQKAKKADKARKARKARKAKKAKKGPCTSEGGSDSDGTTDDATDTDSNHVPDDDGTTDYATDTGSNDVPDDDGTTDNATDAARTKVVKKAPGRVAPRQRAVRLGNLVSDQALKAAWHDIRYPANNRPGGGCCVQKTRGWAHGTCADNILRSSGDNLQNVLRSMAQDRARAHETSSGQSCGLVRDLEHAATLAVRNFTKKEEDEHAAIRRELPGLRFLAKSSQEARKQVKKSEARLATVDKHQNKRVYEFTNFRIRNDDVCQSCYRQWYGWSKLSAGPTSWLKKAWGRNVRKVKRKMWGRGGRLDECAATRLCDEDPDENYEFDDTRPESLRASIMVAWLRLLAMRVGEMMPMVTKNAELSATDVEFRLPPGTKGAVHNEYVADLKACGGGDDALSYTAFLRVWSRHCLLQNIVISRTKGEFVRCDSCINYSNLLQTESRPTVRADLRHQRRVHMYKMWMERKCYYERREEARQHPDDLLSIIIDGMDQRKSEIPRVPRGQVTHALDALYRVRQTITGALVHHVGRFFYISTSDIKGGATLEIECLHRTIARTLEYKLANKLPRPKDLCIQMDNCGHQKNKYMMAYLTHLIATHQFENITLSFLEKGHTHEDIDQAFSVLSGAFKRSTCHTPSEFRDQIHAAFPHTPGINEARGGSTRMFTHVEQIEYTHDVVSWMTPALDKKLKYIQKPHVFTFQLNTAGAATMHYKAWWRREHWKPTATVERDDFVDEMDADTKSADEEGDGLMLPSTRAELLRSRTRELRATSVAATAREKKSASAHMEDVFTDVSQFAVATAAEDSLAGVAATARETLRQGGGNCDRPAPPGAYLSEGLEKEMVLNNFLIKKMGPIRNSKGFEF